jgi:hypothetical protein
LKIKTTNSWYELRAKKNILWSLIKQLGEFYGEEKEALREFGQFVFIEWETRIDEAILCFQDLVDGLKWLNEKNKV